MDIQLIERPRMDIGEFADAHGLTMQVSERSPKYYCADNDFKNSRYYAEFAGTEVADGIFLISKHGNGATVEAAIKDYARKISECTLVIGAYTPERLEIRTPVLTAEGEYKWPQHLSKLD